MSRDITHVTEPLGAAVETYADELVRDLPTDEAREVRGHIAAAYSALTEAARVAGFVRPARRARP